MIDLAGGRIRSLLERARSTSSSIPQSPAHQFTIVVIFIGGMRGGGGEEKAKKIFFFSFFGRLKRVGRSLASVAHLYFWEMTGFEPRELSQQAGALQT